MRRPLLVFALLLLNIVSKAQFRDGLDLTFGKDGLAIRSLFPSESSSEDRILDAQFQMDEKIVAIAGNHIVRFLPNGDFDSSFGSYGICLDKLSDIDGLMHLNFTLQKLAIQSDGSIIVIGNKNISKDPMVVKTRMFVSKIFNYGKVDSAFGFNGTYTDSSLIGLYAADLKILKDDNIIISADSNSKACLVKIKKHGVLDSSFGYNGKVIDYFSNGFAGPRIAIDKDEKIVQVRHKLNLARYLPNGKLDSTFNKTGKTLINPISFSVGYSSTSPNIRISMDGKIWIAGNTSSFEIIEPFTLGRFTSDGVLDSTFNAVGYAQYPWDTSRLNLFSDMLIDHSGKVILAGTVINKISKKDNFGLMRVNIDGTLDTGFGVGGKIITQLYGYSVRPDQLYCILEQSDHKLLAFGHTSDNISKSYATIARYHGNGKSGIMESTKIIDNLFNVYPNPSNGNIIITSPNTIGAVSGGIKIYDLFGRVVHQEQLNFSHNKASINLSISKGSYLIEMRDELANVQREILIVE